MNLILTSNEVESLTGYVWPSKQLQVLHQQGFFRARIGRGGNVLLERVHYDAVCAGHLKQQERPQVKAPQLRRVA